MNNVVLSGHMGADAEERRTTTGKLVANFRMAIDDRGNKDAPAQWVSVTCWEKTAEFVTKYLGKGRKVLVSGHLQVREWEKDGQKRSAVEVVAERVEFMDSSPGKVNASATSSGGEDVVPF